MKTLKTLTAAVLMVLSLSAFANDELSARMKLDYPLNAYIDAFTHGKIKEVQNVMLDDAKFTYNLGNKVMTFSKEEIMGQLKNSKNVEQNCHTDYTLIEMSASQAIVKVNMHYDLFTKTDLINVAKTNSGWKITNVSSSFTNK